MFTNEVTGGCGNVASDNEGHFEIRITRYTVRQNTRNDEIRLSTKMETLEIILRTNKKSITAVNTATRAVKC